MLWVVFGDLPRLVEHDGSAFLAAGRHEFGNGVDVLVVADHDFDACFEVIGVNAKSVGKFNQ